MNGFASGRSRRDGPILPVRWQCGLPGRSRGLSQADRGQDKRAKTSQQRALEIQGAEAGLALAGASKEKENGGGETSHRGAGLVRTSVLLHTLTAAGWEAPDSGQGR